MGATVPARSARITQTVKLVRLEKFLSLRNSLQEALDRLKEGSTGSTETA